MNLTEWIKEKDSLIQADEALKKNYEKEKALLSDKLKKTNEAISLLADGVDYDRVLLALDIIEVRGECSDKNKKHLASIVMSDLSSGCEKLKKQFFGYKVYSGFGEQRSDHGYGYGPRHGSIVFHIGLKKPREELTPEQIEDCIYLLCNIDSLEKATKAA